MGMFYKRIITVISVSLALILLLGGCTTNSVRPQTTPVLYQNVWTAYSGSTNVNSMAFDKQGYLWAGTDAGLMRVDPKTNKYLKYDIFNSGIASNVITAVVIDSSGAKWLGTGEGVVRFDGTTWTNYTTADGLTDNQVNAIAIDAAGNKWFGTNGGVSELSGTTWKRYTTADGLASQTVTCIVVDKSGNEWFGTDGGLSRFDGSNWITYIETDDGLPGDYVSCLAVDATGALWIAGNDHPEVMRTIDISAVSRFDGNTWSTYTVSWGGITGNNVNVLTPTADGDMWVGTGGGPGLLSDGKWTIYDSRNSSLGVTNSNTIGTDSVNAIVLDSAGVIWFGTDRGLTEKNGSQWTNLAFNQNGPANDSATFMAIDGKGRLWCTSWVYQAGLSMFDGDKWTVYNSGEHGLTDLQISCLFADKSGIVWLGTGGGVCRFDGKTGTMYTKDNSPLAGNEVYSIIQDKADNLWFATDGGVSEFTGSVWINHGKLGGPMVVDITGNVWFGIIGGLREFNGTTSTDYMFPKGTSDLWEPTQITVDNKGNIWFSLFINAGGGIGKFDGTNWTFYTKTDGLLDNQVNAIEWDTSGNVWSATNYGVSEFDGTTWTNFTPANSGLMAGQIMSIAEDRSGNLWFGGYSYGVSRFGLGMPSTQVISQSLIVSASVNWPVSKDLAESIAFRLLPPGRADSGTISATLQNGANAQSPSPTWFVTISGLTIPQSILDWQPGPGTTIDTSVHFTNENIPGNFGYFEFEIDAITGNVISKSAWGTKPAVGG